MGLLGLEFRLHYLIASLQAAYGNTIYPAVQPPFRGKADLITNMAASAANQGNAYDNQGANYNPQGSSYNTQGASYNPQGTYNHQGTSYSQKGLSSTTTQNGFSVQDKASFKDKKNIKKFCFFSRKPKPK